MIERAAFRWNRERLIGRLIEEHTPKMSHALVEDEGQTRLRVEGPTPRTAMSVKLLDHVHPLVNEGPCYTHGAVAVDGLVLGAIEVPMGLLAKLETLEISDAAIEDELKRLRRVRQWMDGEHRPAQVRRLIVVFSERDVSVAKSPLKVFDGKSSSHCRCLTRLTDPALSRPAGDALPEPDYSQSNPPAGSAGALS